MQGVLTCLYTMCMSVTEDYGEPAKSRFCHSKLWTLKMQWPQLTMPLYLILQHTIWVHGFQTTVGLHIFADCAACSQWSCSRAHTKL